MIRNKKKVLGRDRLATLNQVVSNVTTRHFAESFTTEEVDGDRVQHVTRQHFAESFTELGRDQYVHLLVGPFYDLGYVLEVFDVATVDDCEIQAVYVEASLPGWKSDGVRTAVVCATPEYVADWGPRADAAYHYLPTKVRLQTLIPNLLGSQAVVTTQEDVPIDKFRKGLRRTIQIWATASPGLQTLSFSRTDSLLALYETTRRKRLRDRNEN